MRTDQSISKINTQKKIIMLPIGSCEQHGPHLPIDTDLRIAQLLAENLCTFFLSDEYLLLPPLPFSSSWEHTGPGTISLSAQTMSGILHDMAYSMKKWSNVTLFVLLNWHGGNSLLSSLAAEISAKENIPTIAIHGISEASALWTKRTRWEAKEDIHAGALETAIVKAFWPDLVPHTINASDSYTIGINHSLIQPLMQALNTRAFTEKGIWGSPHLADADIGKSIIEDVSQSIFSRIQELLQILEKNYSRESMQ